MGLLKNIKKKIKGVTKDVSESVHKVKEEAAQKIKDRKSASNKEKEEKPEPEKEVAKIPHEDHKYDPAEKEPDKFPGTYDVKRKDIGKEVFEKTGLRHEGVGQSSTVFKPQENPVKIAHGIKQDTSVKMTPEINQENPVKVSHRIKNRKHLIKRTGGVRTKHRGSDKKP